MKQLHLSIPKPCHKDWNAMSAAEKGKFCAACQKTVVDFTSMSDRQLGEFFKKQEGSICGRFYPDQLHRPIALPKKSIPWARYFFRFTWPALVLFLKSCGSKEVKREQIVHSAARSGDQQPPPRFLPTVGMPIRMEMQEEKQTAMNKTSAAKQVEEQTSMLVGEIRPMVENVNHEEDTPLVEGRPMDTIVVNATPNVLKGKVLMGDVLSQCRRPSSSDTIAGTAVQTLPDGTQKASAYKVFPNPIAAGAVLTISFSSVEQMPGQVDLLTSAGSVILSTRVPAQEATVFNLRLPPNISRGIYFLRLSHQSRPANVTEKIIVQ